MNLESQVINLELAKRMKKLGIKQNSLFYWRDYKSDAGSEVIYAPNVFHENSVTVYDYYSAFTVAELISMLLTIFKHDIIIPNNVNVPNFLSEKISGFHEAKSKKN